MDSNISFWIMYAVAAIWVLVPLAVGIPMCIRNKEITTGFKVAWCFAFLFFGMIAFLIFLAIYYSRRKNNTPS